MQNFMKSLHPGCVILCRLSQPNFGHQAKSANGLRQEVYYAMGGKRPWY